MLIEHPTVETVDQLQNRLVIWDLTDINTAGVAQIYLYILPTTWYEDKLINYSFSLSQTTVFVYEQYKTAETWLW